MTLRGIIKGKGGNDMNSHERDLELSNKVINGDHGSFSTLLGGARPLIRGRALKAVGCGAAADDITQQTIISAYVNLDKFRGESAFASWVYAITTNYIRMYLRTRRRIEKKEEGEPIHGYRDMVDVRTPRDDAELKEVCVMIEDAIGSLTPKYREVVELWITGITTQDMSRYLDISRPAVKSRLHRARKCMKVYITQKYGKAALNEIF
jgi:RNA polymerase sigma-70 factor (ECF subfamily)